MPPLRRGSRWRKPFRKKKHGSDRAESGRARAQRKSRRLFPTAPLFISRTRKRFRNRRNGKSRSRSKPQNNVDKNWLPTVQIPRKLSDFFDGVAPTTSANRLTSNLDAVHLKTVLAEYERERISPGPTSVLMCIGPEGDFTPAELNPRPKSRLSAPSRSAPLFYRVETAAIYCLSCSL